MMVINQAVDYMGYSSGYISIPKKKWQRPNRSDGYAKGLHRPGTTSRRGDCRHQRHLGFQWYFDGKTRYE